MMAYGVEKTLVATGSNDNVLVARKAANGEISSILLSNDYNTVLTLPHVARNPDGSPVATGDVVVVINSVAKNFVGMSIGSTVKFGGDMWTVVGRYDGGGSGFDSEVWGDADQLMDAFNRRGGYSTMTFKLDDPKSYSAFVAAFNREPRLQQFEPKLERRFFEEQSEAMSMFIRILGIFITVIISFGATIGAMITMYAAVANRTVEVGTLRALGFRRRSVLSAFLMESLMISLLGGMLGLFLASFLQFFSVSTLNYGSFSELEFSFALSPSIVTSSILFALAMGFIGGFLPAVRAARLNIVNALRSA